MFHTASEQEIKTGKIADQYFVRTLQILKAKGINNRVVAEVTLKGTPPDWSWGVLAGIEELAFLLEGLPIDVLALPEGTVFAPGQPLVVLEGLYQDFCAYETALLGLLCQASGIATKASRCKKAAQERVVLSFGARRMHPAIAPMIERNAFIGGCDGVAVGKSAELIGESPRGTVPHALVLLIGDTVEAMKAFHEVIEPAVKRVALIDTFGDEKLEALKVAEALGENLFALRLDTPSSRRGDMLQILKEVRWELDYRGFTQVKLFVSGGLDERQIQRLNEAADAYGVGTAISNAPVINFSFDIVEIEGQPIAKKGKFCGRKQLWRCRECDATRVLAAHTPADKCPACGGQPQALLQPLIKEGQPAAPLPTTQAIRQYVLQQLADRELF